MENFYPPSPSRVPQELNQPSKKYRHQVILAVISLLIFIGIYLALAGSFTWMTYKLVQRALQYPEKAWENYMLASCSTFLALFMIKAVLFKEKKSDQHELYEVTAESQPVLFQFINQIADEAEAPRPYKVFLSARVNAAVFYDLSILNLIPFFSTRKNLEIGMALVNVLNLSELKAVLAHEFGHFAQRSMAIGTWVYITQKIATSMVSKRDSLDKILKFLCNIDLRVAWIGWLLSLMVWSIRSLMDSLLSVVILAQRALSRQMEFQADLVAVRLTGSEELVNALHKLQAADDAWQRTISFMHNQLNQSNKKPNDLFTVQQQILQHLETILADPHYLHPPQTSNPSNKKTHRVFKNNFANPPQMWATHPANADREENAKKIYVDGNQDTRSPWLLFQDIDQIKASMPKQLFHNIDHVEDMTSLEEKEALHAMYGKIQYQSQYRGAYLGRVLTRSVPDATHLYDELFTSNKIEDVLQTLYPTTLANDLTQLRELQEEHATVEAIKDKIYQAQGGRIIFRGQEIRRRDLKTALAKLNKEIQTVRQKILAHDKTCRNIHLHIAKQLGNGWDSYFKGLLNVLHYAEHTLADILDVQGVLGNVVAVITADGNVSRHELKRLLKTINETVYPVLQRIYLQKNQVVLDESLCQCLDIESWPKLFDEFSLPNATHNNINDWMKVIDGWLYSAINPLALLAQKSLEQILVTEQLIQSAYLKQNSLDSAPTASEIKISYSSFMLGAERPLQKRLGIWDRFLVADGYFGAWARFLVAISIVGSVFVLWFTNKH